MAQLRERPFEPGDYPLVIVGSGPGGLQVSHELMQLGVRHAVLSGDESPGGMFRRWPLFQRLLSWTKPFAPFERTSRFYERYDWNSLLAHEAAHRALMVSFMDGTSNYPARQEMEGNLVAFAERTGVTVRYGCRWEATRRDGDGFVLVTSDGEYRARVVVFAIGVAQPYHPPVPGLDAVPHYASMKPIAAYAGKRVFIVGKGNSGFELAQALLPVAQLIVLASPSPTRLAINTLGVGDVRARYLLPFEDHRLRGGVYVLDVVIEGVVRERNGYRVRTRFSTSGVEAAFDVDEVVDATGFIAPLGDLPDLGVATFGRNGLPAQTPFWESATVPGIYFAGTITQGAAGLKKHGIASSSGAVHGFRYNARILARHIAERHFAITVPHPALAPDAVVPYLLSEATRAPELWLQRSYLGRVVCFDRSRGIRDEGILPLQHFLEAETRDAVAITVETNPQGETYPALYVRQGGALTEQLLPSHTLLEFDTPEHRKALGAALRPLLPAAVAPA